MIELFLLMLCSACDLDLRPGAICLVCLPRIPDLKILRLGFRIYRMPSKLYIKDQKRS